MPTMKEMTGVDWPMSEKTKRQLIAKRQERRNKLLSKPENKRVYDAVGLAYQVAEQLHEARRKAHLTQSELAGILRTSQSHLARIEQGRNITLTTLDEYAKACGRKVRIQLI